MVTPTNIGTRNIPLKFARIVTEMANKEWEAGIFLEKVTPITKDLLKFWFSDSFCETRNINFHEGQKQAILNIIYLHEILKCKNVYDMYMSANLESLTEVDMLDLKKDKYNYSKYGVKMATGTGKTWVLHAILIWQYLNAKYEETPNGRYSKNFLLVAPGLIVYERLRDAFLGKEQEDGTRDFEKSDFKMFENLFIPPAFRDIVFGFIQSNVVKKEEIGKKVTGEGLIAITNWHLLAGVEEEENYGSPLDDPSKVVKEILPITPGTTAGHSLNELDNNYSKGKEIEYLRNLPDLVIFNDEAHHIHEVKKAGEIFEVEWQKSLTKISETKKDNFIQIDFSATPFNVSGSGQKRTKHFFPHIIVNFDLVTAIKKGFVKTIALDKRKDIAALPLDFKAEREGKTVIGLSKGQKIMIRAGLQKLKILEKEFVALTADRNGISNKYPKMLIICEDTKVTPQIITFLKSEGLSDEDVMQIDSNKKGQIPQKEWIEIKQKLFNMDKHETPKVIVSVLMLREGFDVNNICVIVPLRSSTSYILLEQIIGRGLRIMWREPEFQEIKKENRIKLLEKKEEPNNYLDILSIVEHPAFIQFYDSLLRDGAIGATTEIPTDRRSILGDIIKVGLRKDYKNYDFFWPIIVRDKEENLAPKELSFENLAPFPIPLEDLKKLVHREGDTFYSEEITVKTRFGEYSVTADIFTAKSYNEFIARLVNGVSSLVVGEKNKKTFPMMQVNTVEIAKLTDNYIKHKLFNQDFDPLKDNNWRVLLLSKSKIVTHIIKQVSQTIYDLQKNIEITDAKVIKKFFSEVSEIKMRENFSLDISKVIYEKLAYPSHKGGFEKSFIEFVDTDSKVRAFLKINENYHDFAHIFYIREDGLLARYYPDFIVRIDNKIYLVETKAQKDLSSQNVKQKRLATIDWITKINELKAEDRMNCTWNYVLLGENTFYEMRDKGGSTEEILEYAKLTKSKVEGTLGDFVEGM